MNLVLGYSVYWHESQSKEYKIAYSIKSDIVRNSQQEESNYGTGFDTILIFYNFETVLDEFSGTDFLQKKISVYRYNGKEKSIRVNVFVGFNEFTGKTEEEQIAFYYRTTLQALLLVKEKFSKRKNRHVNFDFDRLLEDVKQGYLKAYPDLRH